MRDHAREVALSGTPTGRMLLAAEGAEHRAAAADKEGLELDAAAANARVRADEARMQATGFRQALATLEVNGFKQPAALSITTDAAEADWDSGAVDRQFFTAPSQHCMVDP